VDAAPRKPRTQNFARAEEMEISRNDAAASRERKRKEKTNAWTPP
jgi:hypothetical protein